MKKAPLLVPVSRRALFQRVSRALAKKGQRLRAYRRGRSGTLGDYYIVDLNRKALVAAHEDLEQLGWRLGVLEEFEAPEQIDADAVADAREKEREARRSRAAAARRRR